MTDNTMRAAALKPVAWAVECMYEGRRICQEVYLTEDCAVVMADPKKWVKGSNPSIVELYDAAALATARAEGYKAGMERAAEICESEHLEDPTETNGDMAYDNAIRHCADAIRAEIGKEGK